jgi:hypothetical protein
MPIPIGGACCCCCCIHGFRLAWSPGQASACRTECRKALSSRLSCSTIERERDESAYDLTLCGVFVWVSTKKEPECKCVLTLRHSKESLACPSLNRHQKGAGTAMRRRIHASEKALKHRGIKKELEVRTSLTCLKNESSFWRVSRRVLPVEVSWTWLSCCSDCVLQQWSLGPARATSRVRTTTPNKARSQADSCTYSSEDMMTGHDRAQGKLKVCAASRQIKGVCCLKAD